jgi:simple sugar transport system substrate-binding protein
MHSLTGRRRAVSRCAGLLSVAALSVLLAACSQAGQKSGTNANATKSSASSGDTSAKHVDITFVSLAGPSDAFFGVINRGAQQAAKDLGNVTVNYVYPDHTTLSEYDQKVQQALTTQPDGMLVFGLDKSQDALYKKVHDQGVALAMNPAPSVKQAPLRMQNDIFVSRVGSDEYSAGRLAASRMIQAGAKGEVVCGIQIPGDGTLTTRCNGVKDELATKGIKTDIVPIANEPGQSAEQLTNYLRAHPDVSAIITLGGPPNAGARKAKQQAGRPVLLGGFDDDPATLQDIAKGGTLFTIDQQPFWRGYIAVLELVHYIRYGLVQANYFLSGPVTVDKTNVKQVIGLAEKGLR